MTSMQEKMVEKLKKDAIWMDGLEIKRCEVDDGKYFVSVCIEVGYPGDEGTMRAVLCREHVQVFVGPKGGMKYPVSKHLKNGSFKHYYKTYKSFLSTSIDQE